MVVIGALTDTRGQARPDSHPIGHHDYYVVTDGSINKAYDSQGKPFSQRDDISVLIADILAMKTVGTVFYGAGDFPQKTKITFNKKWSHIGVASDQTRFEMKNVLADYQAQMITQPTTLSGITLLSASQALNGLYISTASRILDLNIDNPTQDGIVLTGSIGPLVRGGLRIALPANGRYALDIGDSVDSQIEGPTLLRGIAATASRPKAGVHIANGGGSGYIRGVHVWGFKNAEFYEGANVWTADMFREDITEHGTLFGTNGSYDIELQGTWRGMGRLTNNTYNCIYNTNNNLQRLKVSHAHFIGDYYANATKRIFESGGGTLAYISCVGQTGRVAGFGSADPLFVTGGLATRIIEHNNNFTGS